MPTESDATPAYENPLIPNARLRQIYAAILHARLLGNSLPKAQRTQTRGLEAALVSTAVDLAAQDLISDALATPVIALLRATSFAASTTHKALTPSLTPKQRAALNAWTTPATLPPTPTIADRIGAAIGAAASLAAAASKSNSYAKAKGGTIRQPGVLVAYTRPGEVPTSLWQKALAFAARHELPLVFVVLPPERIKNGNTYKKPARLSGVIATALRNTVPGITVDANDPIALYRVAQESIARARMGGGPALIECIPFIASGTQAPPEDALPSLDRYLLHRGVATRTWMDREAKAFTRSLASNRKN